MNGTITLAPPYNPNTRFSVGAAMGRNRLIYCLADFAIVVASDIEIGGTGAGATEVLKHGWIPVFALDHSKMPDGNKLLLQRGALPFPHPFQEPPLRLVKWLGERAKNHPESFSQMELF
jgi:predicted Rossmann fold nucleotide-binding protein DprA/Smf involved in DNA uptake